MYDLQFYDLNLYGIFLLLALLVIIFSKREKQHLRGRLFHYLIWTTIFMLMFEIFSWLFVGLPGTMNYALNLVFNTLVTGVSVFVASVWAMYIDYIIFNDKVRFRKVSKYYLLPAFSYLILAIINMFVPFLFVIDESNVYTRLGGIWIPAILVYSIYAAIVYLVYKQHRRLNSNFIYGVMIFLILPQIAVVLQLLFFGLTLIWPTTAIAIVFSYLLFETNSSTTDYLTGVKTRLRAEDYMHSLLQKNKPFSLFLIDMDDFKEINDNYGHHSGDKALIEMGRVLQETFRKNGIVARFGGDEFIVVVETTNADDIHKYRNQMYKILSNSNIEYVLNMKFSIGTAICPSEGDCSIDQLMIRADNDMYKDKAKNKNLKRRKEDR